MNEEHPTTGALLERLRAEGLHDDSRDAAIQAQLGVTQSPWYLHVLAGVGGLLAASLFLCFFGAIDLLDDAIASLVLGVLMTVVSLAMRRMKGFQGVLRQSFLTLSLVGQGLVVAGIAREVGDDLAPHLTYLALAIPLYLVDREAIHRFLVSLVSFHSLWFLAIEEFQSPWMAHGLLAVLVVLAASVLSDRVPAASSRRLFLRPAAYAATLALVTGSLLALDTTDTVLVEWVARAIVAVPFGIVIGLIAHDTDVEERRPAQWAGGFAALLALVSSAGVLVSLLFLALGFWRVRRPLIVLGSVTLCGFLVHFYYSLEVTLLVKSGVLLASGLVLLGAREWLRRQSWMEALLEEEGA